MGGEDSEDSVMEDGSSNADVSKADDATITSKAATEVDEKGGGGVAMDVDGEEEKKTKKKKEPEPPSFVLSNPCRITKAQADVCAFDRSQRYQPIRNHEKPCGVILVSDSTPGEEEDLGTVKPPSIESEDEADLPEPFIWTPPGHTDVTSSTSNDASSSSVT